MPTTIAEQAELAFHEHAGSTTQEKAGIYLYQIEAMFPSAVRQLVEMALRGATLPRQYLTALFTITNVAGRFPLAAHSTLEIRSIPKATVRLEADDVEYSLQYVPNPSEIRYPQPGLDYVYYTIENEVIITRDLAGELDTFTGALRIENGIFRPVIAASSGSTTLPEQLEKTFRDILGDMIKAKLGMMPHEAAG